ncbi:hypothetical protein HRI_003313700 [Hibiscus trionum]|uniref:Yippee domain-containing protein n=1 Tax=Hibiscus trionum TaxID=183268 RepID=A0A9W7ILT9_HIBTR|nr:hypothetical protein HRI_003313700 [Hibiscus trionum]
MGRVFMITLEGSVYSCKHCHTHLALFEDIISKSFHCRHGKAYLFDKVVNISVGEKEDRMMMTGMHTVVDIFCVGCGSIVGWKYESAHEKTQKYKEGKFILERFKVLGPDGSNYMVSHEALVSQANHHDDDDEEEDIEEGDPVQPPRQAPQYPTETLAILGAIGSLRDEVHVISNRMHTLEEHMAHLLSQFPQPQLPQDD